MRWINSLHRGFNRVLVVVSVIGACLFVWVKHVDRAYHVPAPSPPMIIMPMGSESWSKEEQNRAEQRYRERENYKKQDAYYREAVKTYPIRVWIARGLGVLHLLLAFLIIFAIGHGGFYLVVWVIRGFTTQ